jgi:hypothetical protein
MDSASAAAEVTARRAPFLIGGRRVEAATTTFSQAIAWAHAERQRPLCLCVSGGVEMYVARLAGTSESFVIKRMPGTGSRHAPDCPCYEPPADASGLGQVIGSAIIEDPATGQTTLKLDFPLVKLAGRSTNLPQTRDSGSVESTGTRLSLRGLLHYLWDQADLTRWHPGFLGKRTWATVRRHLLQAAENKFAHGDPLRSRLYIPEPFSLEHRDAINTRRALQWSRATAEPGKPQHLMLLIAEVKEIVRARYGLKAIIKHVPEQGFALDEPFYRRLCAQSAWALAMWDDVQDVHMLMIATFSVSPTGNPTIVEASLMPVTSQWVPVEDAWEKQLIDRLVSEGRSFIKGLRYNLGSGSALTCATLIDCEGTARLLYIVPSIPANAGSPCGLSDRSMVAWLWNPSCEPIPRLPDKRAQHA